VVHPPGASANSVDICKQRIHLLFSSAKKRYTALMYVCTAPIGTVAHGLSVRKEKERIAKKRCMGGGGKRKEKKRKDLWEMMRLEPATLRVSSGATSN
jgi:hypothetical protein